MNLLDFFIQVPATAPNKSEPLHVHSLHHEHYCCHSAILLICFCTQQSCQVHMPYYAAVHGHGCDLLCGNLKICTFVRDALRSLFMKMMMQSVGTDRICWNSIEKHRRHMSCGIPQISDICRAVCTHECKL